MKILIIYDSVFGNTEIIAKAIANSFDAGDSVECKRIKEILPDQLLNLDLLIVGSPTRQFRATPNITSFLSGLGNKSIQGINIAGFDTRISLNVIKSKVFRFVVNKGGYAAKIITTKLIAKGGVAIAPPEGFFVSGEEGPLEKGEDERAAQWAKTISSKIKLCV